MPRMNKGGKFVFGKSRIRDDLAVRLPPQAVAEYDIVCEGRVYLFTGSKSTGGFCVTRKGLLQPSKLGHILADNPGLRDYLVAEGEFVPYKGRSYCWVGVSEDGVIRLSNETLRFLDVEEGMELLAIRSSDIAFTMGAKGPLLDRAEAYEGEIEVF